MEHNIVLHKHNAALNIGSVNIGTLKNVISHSETLNQCKIK